MGKSIEDVSDGNSEQRNGATAIKLLTLMYEARNDCVFVVMI